MGTHLVKYYVLQNGHELKSLLLGIFFFSLPSYGFVMFATHAVREAARGVDDLYHTKVTAQYSNKPKRVEPETSFYLVCGSLVTH